MARCDGCHAEVVWLENDRTGRRAPVNLTPDPKGNVTRTEGDRYHVLTKAQMERFDNPGMLDPMPPTRFTLHFATCPNAEHFRRDHVAHRDAGNPGRKTKA